MKAIRKSDGKVIEVREWRGSSDVIYSELDMNAFYQASDLDFSVNEAKEAEGKVLSGWVARDNGGFISLFSYLPDRVTKDNLGFWGHNDGSNEIDMPQDSFPSLTWDDDPMEVEIIIKPKKKSSTK